MKLKKKMKSKFSKLSLRNKIIYFSIIIFSSFLVIISVITVNLLDKTIITSEINYSKKNNILIKNNLNGLVNNTENLLRVLSTEAQFQKDMLDLFQNDNPSSAFLLNTSSSLGKSVSNIIFPNTSIIGACIWDYDDIYYSGYCINPDDIKGLLPYKKIKETNNNQAILWSPLSKIKYSYGIQKNVFPVTKTIIHKDFGYVLGYVTLFLSEQTVSKIFDVSDLNENKQEYFVVANESNTVISSTDKNLLNSKVDSLFILKDEKFKELFEKGFILEDKYFYSVSKGIFNDNYIISKIDLSDFYRVRQNQFLLISLLVSITILIVAIGSYWLSITVTKPIYSIINIMEKIKKGDFSSRIESEILDPELKNFALAFNRLMDRLELSIAEIYQQQQELRKSELLLIQSQIKPHFLYNSMETISSFIQLGLYEKALLTLHNLAGFYRKTLSNGRDIIYVKEEIEIISYYLKLQELRYTDYLNYTIEIDENLYNYEIPKLLLQPLVENAIYHGIKPLDKMGELIICGYKKNNRIYFEVYDNGVGIEESKLEDLKSKLKDDKETSNDDSFGLMSVKRRLKIFYGKDALFEIDSVEGEYTQIYISLQVSEKKVNL